MLRVRRCADPVEFLQRAGKILARAEAENSLMLSICSAAAAESAFPDDGYLGVVEDSGTVRGCGIRTPPFKALITQSDPTALGTLVDDVLDKYPGLDALMGPEPAASIFADICARRLGTSLRVGVRHRLFELTQVRALARRPPGSLRVAVESDFPQVAEWAVKFHREVGLADLSDPKQTTRRAIDQRRLFVWDVGGPVSMASWVRPTSSGVAINFVYTPPEHRQKGYASACVADLSAQLLRDGRSFCCLYTDLANPTSNKIYQEIGYRPVSDATDYHITRNL